MTMAPERKPDWLRVRLRQGENGGRLDRIVQDGGLHTVCQEALCPNRGTCWEKGRATLMILGDVCSRNCRFCNVTAGRPGDADLGEPERVAEAVRQMGLMDVVITSVTRDDLPDGGAAIWADTIRQVRAKVPGISIEVLIPDFGGSEESLDMVLAARPHVLAHNLETVPTLYALVRPAADYHRSLTLLARASRSGLIVKTGLMVGLGETDEAVLQVMRDARGVGCHIFTLGQYLQPSKRHLPVARYVEPDRFERFKREGLAMGFEVVVSGPLVRSSYHTDEQAEFVSSRR